MLLNRELSYSEFRGFYECINKTLTEAEFQNEILKNFCSSSRGITIRGFKEFWRQSTKDLGEVCLHPPNHFKECYLGMAGKLGI
jgi:hypothetical protein